MPILTKSKTNFSLNSLYHFFKAIQLFVLVARQPEKSMTLVIVLVAVTLVILIVSLIACALSRKMRPRCLSRDGKSFYVFHFT